MPDLVDFLSGAVPAQLRAGLSQAPWKEPQTLADFEPATFGGYVASDFVLSQQAAGAPGWGCVSGGATFVWDGTGDVPRLTGMWIIATYERAHYLVHVVKLIGTEAAVLAPGKNNIMADIAAHVIPPR